MIQFATRFTRSFRYETELNDRNRSQKGPLLATLLIVAGWIVVATGAILSLALVLSDNPRLTVGETLGCVVSAPVLSLLFFGQAASLKKFAAIEEKLAAGLRPTAQSEEKP